MMAEGVVNPPETTPEDPKPPPTVSENPKPSPDESTPPRGIYDVLKNKWNSITKNPYRMKVIFCAMLFLFALETAGELKHIAIPMFLYRPFRKATECLKCLLKVICS
ncbi:hypothetical protein QE152_g7297 [Popillia japonica]|uniref:Uncharacterized protein n=1 Tax=Popillia japonica TaxID=7064 RepID=A0AAW1MFN5_POPJA